MKVVDLVDTSGGSAASLPRDAGLLALEDGHVEPVERAEPLALGLARSQSAELDPELVAPRALGGLVRCVS